MGRISDAEVTQHVESVSECTVNFIYYKENSSGRRKMLNLTCECGSLFDVPWVKFNRPDRQPQRQCRKCGIAKRGVAQRISDAEYSARKVELGINIEHLEHPKGRTVGIRHRCPVCGTIEWFPQPANILSGASTKCSSCARIIAHNKKDDDWYQSEKERLGIDVVNVQKYKTSSTPIWHICPECSGGWLVRPGSVLRKTSNACTPCSYTLRSESRVLTNEEVSSILNDLSLDWVSGEYEGKDSVLTLRCSCGNLFDKRFGDARSGWNRCSKCAFSISTGEQCIKDYLDENSIQYTHQQKFEDLRGKRNMPLSYDFGIYDNDRLIVLVEYDGEHHFRPILYRYETEKEAVDSFEAVKKRDKRKNEYARKIGIPLIRLSGKQYKNLDANLGSKLTEILQYVDTEVSENITRHRNA